MSTPLAAKQCNQSHDPVGPEARPALAVVPVSRARSRVHPIPEPSAVTRARVALCARLPISTNELNKLAKERRQQSIRTSLVPPRKTLSCISLLVVGIAISVWGGMQHHLWLLLSGYALTFLGMVVGSLLLATALTQKRQLLSRFYLYAEHPASKSEIQALERAIAADPELAELTQAWWHCDEPVRRSDITLAMAFKQAKQAAKMEYWQQGRR